MASRGAHGAEPLSIATHSGDLACAEQQVPTCPHLLYNRLGRYEPTLATAWQGCEYSNSWSRRLKGSMRYATGHSTGVFH